MEVNSVAIKLSNFLANILALMLLTKARILLTSDVLDLILPLTECFDTSHVSQSQKVN